MKTAPLVSTFNAFTKLHNTAINTTSSLVIDEIKKQVDKDLIKQSTLAVGFRYNNRLVEIHNFGNTINKAFYGSGFKSYVTVEAEMTLSQANNYVGIINKYLGKDTNKIIGKSIKLYDNGEKIGGNYHVDEHQKNNKVVMYVFVREDSAVGLSNAIAKKGADALNKEIKSIYDTQKKNLSKVNMPSAAVIKLGCVYSLISAIDAYKKNKDFSDLWKLISSILVVLQNASEVASWTLTKFAEDVFKKTIVADAKLTSDEILQKASKNIVNSERAMICSKIAGHAVSLMAIYDAIKGTLETIDIHNSGGLSEDCRNKAISTGVSFISSVVVGLFISNIFIGAIVAVAAIAILFFFDVNRVVPECIQYWLRRSKFGKEGSTAPGRPFENIEVEQGSLSMLFKGVYFSALISNKDREYRDKRPDELTPMEKFYPFIASDGRALSKEVKNVVTTISFPNNFSGYVSLVGKEEQSKDIVMNNVYLFDDARKVCKIVLDALSSVEGPNEKEIPVVDNSRIRYYENIISVKNGQDLWVNINKSEIKSIENIILNEKEPGTLCLSETSDFCLMEDSMVKVIDFIFSIGCEKEETTQNYKLVLEMGSRRKN